MCCDFSLEFNTKSNKSMFEFKSDKAPSGSPNHQIQ